METPQLETNVSMVNGRLKFSGQCGQNPPVPIDYTPPLGDGEGYTSLELLLMSLSSCAASSVAALLRKMGKQVTGVDVNARGNRRTQHPTCFETISLEFVLKSPDAQAGDVEKAIRLSEESFCPVWAMLKNNVDVYTEYKIVAD